jgi:hypothetical protein
MNASVRLNKVLAGLGFKSEGFKAVWDSIYEGIFGLDAEGVKNQEDWEYDKNKSLYSQLGNLERQDVDMVIDYVILLVQEGSLDLRYICNAVQEYGRVNARYFL